MGRSATKQKQVAIVNIMQNHFKIDLRLLLLVGLAILVLIANLLLFIYHRNNRLEIKKGFTDAITNEYEITLDVYADMADSVYHIYINTPEIKRLFALGVRAQDAVEKDRYRKMLYNELSGLYQRLLKYNFRQLHFHEKNNQSYLRFHRPEKYGDDLTGIRDSVEYVNKKKKYIRGFEEGVIFNGYRFVYPLFVDDEHIGSVEISVSLNSVIRKLDENFDKTAQFLISKNHVMKKVIASEQSNYFPWFIDACYLLDRELSGTCVLENHIIGRDAQKIKNAITANKEKYQPFIVEIVLDSVPRVLAFLPIKNFMGETAAYLFGISDSKKMLDLDKNFYFSFIGQMLLFVFLVVFIVYYRLSQKKIEEMAIFDSLTKLYARGPFMQMVGTEFERYKRYRNPFSLIMIDVDHFKSINDNYGHNIGDVILSAIASIMQSTIRKTDFIGRYGGEEFIVLLPDTKCKNAADVAEKMRLMISENSFHSAGMVTVSCGVVEISEQVQSIEELINEADKNLYTAKHDGRNRVIG